MSSRSKLHGKIRIVHQTAIMISIRLRGHCLRRCRHGYFQSILLMLIMMQMTRQLAFDVANVTLRTAIMQWADPRTSIIIFVNSLFTS
jgi:hypothetical protein